MTRGPGRVASAIAGCALLLWSMAGHAASSDADADGAAARAMLAAYEKGGRHAAIAIAYPLDQTLFPPEIAPPTFRWKDSDSGADIWLVAIAFQDGTRSVGSPTRKTEWAPSPQQWEAIQRRSREADATVTVMGAKRSAPKQIRSAGSVTIRTSQDEVGAPLFFREVNLPFVDAVKDPSRIRWRFGAIDSPRQPPVVLTGLPVCGNCHSFSADGSVLGMDIDDANDKGSYAIAPVAREIVLDKSRIITWSDYRRDDGEPTFGLLSQLSPDGKWIAFCKAKSFMLLQPDSQLYIIPAAGGQARRLRCNTARMNSWHSWSPNSRWLVFSSKANGPYTQLFLTHIDEEGHSAPPVLLEHMTARDRAANIPEFVSIRPQAIEAIRERFLDDHSFARAGDEFLKGGDTARAADAYRKALELNPDNAEAHSNLGLILLRQHRRDEALAHFLKALEHRPDDARCHRNVGDVLVRQGKRQEAMARYREALRIDPAYTEVRINLGLLLLMTHRHDEARAEFAEAVRHEPDSPHTHYHLARALKRQERLREAVPEYQRVLELDPNYLSALLDLAVIRAAGPESALRNGREAVQLASKACTLTRHRDPKMLDALAAAYAETGRFGEALRTGKQALDLARAAGDEKLARNIHSRLVLYTQSRRIPTTR